MLSFLTKKSHLGLRLQLSYVCNQNGTPSTAEAGMSFLLRHFLSTSTSTTTTTPISLSEYLVSSLGLSLSPESDSELALIIATNKNKQTYLNSTNNADSVISLFRDYGYTPTQIASTFSECPILLSYNPHEFLKPKLYFLSGNGISSDHLAQIIANKPFFLERSLHKAIIPCYNFLFDFFGGNSQAIVSHLSKDGGPHLLRWFSESVPLNVETLRRRGVPHSNIVHFMMISGLPLSRDAQIFNEALKEVKEMGFDPSSMMFLYGLQALTSTSKDKWASKVEVFKRFGWTDQQVLTLFVRLLKVMGCSQEQLMAALEYFTERVRWTKDDITKYSFLLTTRIDKKKLMEALEYFTKTLRWTKDDITKYPTLLFSSIDKKICPRLSVLEILMAEVLVKESIMGAAFKMSEDKFLTRFVVKYQEDIPQLLETYQKNMGTGC